MRIDQIDEGELKLFDRHTGCHGQEEASGGDFEHAEPRNGAQETIFRDDDHGLPMGGDDFVDGWAMGGRSGNVCIDDFDDGGGAVFIDGRQQRERPLR